MQLDNAVYLQSRQYYGSDESRQYFDSSVRTTTPSNFINNPLIINHQSSIIDHHLQIHLQLIVWGPYRGIVIPHPSIDRVRNEVLGDEVLGKQHLELGQGWYHPRSGIAAASSSNRTTSTTTTSRQGSRCGVGVVW